MRAFSPSQLRVSSRHKASDSVLFENEWLQLKDKQGYIYSHEVRCNGKIVVILPYRRIGKDAWEFLVRDETTPCWADTPTRSAMTGGIEAEDPREDAVRELQEEAGFTATVDQMQPLGRCRASKSADTYYYLYAIDLADMEPGEAPGDGSKNDAAPAVWISAEELTELEDAQAITTYAKARQQLGIY